MEFGEKCLAKNDDGKFDETIYIANIPNGGHLCVVPIDSILWENRSCNPGEPEYKEYTFVKEDK